MERLSRFWETNRSHFHMLKNSMINTSTDSFRLKMLPTTLCQSLFGGEPIHLKKVLILILLIVSKQIKSQQNSLKPPIQYLYKPKNCVWVGMYFKNLLKKGGFSRETANGSLSTSWKARETRTVSQLIKCHLEPPLIHLSVVAWIKKLFSRFRCLKKGVVCKGHPVTH